MLLPCIAAVIFAVLPGCAGPLSEEQRLADLDYLIEVFSESHPYVSLKKRAEGYDWSAHRDEFESIVAGCKTDGEFALAINRVVGLVNNMHTRLVGGSELSVWFRSDVRAYDDLAPWFTIMDGVSLKRAQYWFDLAQEPEYGNLPVVYSAGEYVVAGSVTGANGLSLPLGSVITSVNGVEVDDFVHSHRGAGWQPYDPIRKKTYDPVLRLPVGSTTVTAIAPNGSSITETFSVSASRRAQTPLTPEGVNGTFDMKTVCFSGCVLDGEVAYLAISQMGAERGAVPESELRPLREFLSNVSDLPALIIDIRGNPGGETILWYHLVSMLISEPLQMDRTVALRDSDYIAPFYRGMIDDYGFLPLDGEGASQRLPIEVLGEEFRTPLILTQTIPPAEDSIKYAGKVYLLVDGRVGSAAEEFAAFSKATGFATLVGGVTGGDGLGFRICYAVLPNSKMVVSFPLSMGINPDGSANEEDHTVPDHLVEWSPAAIAKWVLDPGRANDVVLQGCLKLTAGKPD